jgi:hypothetical protein
MRFPYLPRRLRSPIPSLGGATQVYLPVFAITLITPSGQWAIDGMVDSGATDVVFPSHVAQRAGLNLANAPLGQATQAGGTVLTFRYARARLRIADNRDVCEWDAVVGFLTSPGKPYALLGHAGFLDFFDVLLRGAAKETVVTPNAAFAGQQVQLSP